MIAEARPLVSRRQNALSIPTQLADVGLREEAPGTAERPGLGGIASRRARAFPIASPHSSIVEGGCAFAAWSHPRFACLHPSTSSSSRVNTGSDDEGGGDSQRRANGYSSRHLLANSSDLRVAAGSMAAPSEECRVLVVGVLSPLHKHQARAHNLKVRGPLLGREPTHVGVMARGSATVLAGETQLGYAPVRGTKVRCRGYLSGKRVPA